jgi:hypothetical protein
MNRFKAVVAAFIFAVGFAGSVIAGPFEDANAAYEKGDYATVLRLIRPLAEQGNPRAQNGLGLMYANGEGVPQDYAVAMSWYRKAAEQGHADSIAGFRHKVRDLSDIYRPQFGTITFADPEPEALNAEMTTGAWVLIYFAGFGSLALLFFAVRPVSNAIESRILSYKAEKRVPSIMRRLRMPFLAAAASVIIIAVLSGQRLFPRWSEQDQLIGGLVVGALATVVLYAVMRAIAERNP